MSALERAINWRFMELYSEIETYLSELDQTMDWDVLLEDPEYDYFCDLLAKFDDGDRSMELLREMEEIYAYAS